jgi:hypothetical protein
MYYGIEHVYYNPDFVSFNVIYRLSIFKSVSIGDVSFPTRIIHITLFGNLKVLFLIITMPQVGLIIRQIGTCGNLAHYFF